MPDIDDIWDDELDDEIVRNMNPRRGSPMTDPAPSVQPVRAWVVVDKDKNINANSCCPNNSYIDEIAQAFDREFPTSAPHRVIRVEIREVNDE